TDIDEIARKIVKKGELLYTTEQRKEMLEEKKKSIIAELSKGINPKTGHPHPPKRIKSAMEEAGVHVDLSESVSRQVKDILKEIRPIIPIRFEKRQIAVKIPAEYGPKIYGNLKEKYNVLKEKWGNDGTLYMLISISAGSQDKLYGDLNSWTKGKAETKLAKRK
ncbi:MAG: ribosome assembly factor SBDS, partial [Euryarchaeota archaeon]|nr:ribosome assembly factor SBDS [Euryarchaeota archaeon]